MTKTVWTEDQIVAQLDRTEASWPAGQTVTYSFLQSLPAADQSDPDYKGFQIIDETARASIRAAFANIADVAMVNFAEAPFSGLDGTDSHRITFGASSTLPDYDWGYTITSYFRDDDGRRAIDGADIWLNSDTVAQRRWFVGGYNFQAATHEVLHALGLSHPGDYNADGSDINYDADAEYYQDSLQYTIMSYFDATQTGASFLTGDRIYSAGTLLRDDIAAVQALYGANMSARTGDTVYGFHSNAGLPGYDLAQDPYPIFSVWDAGGNDTLDFSGYSTNQKIDLHQGAFSDVGDFIGSVSIAYGAQIENAVGGPGNDTLIGNDLSNQLRGGAGNDLLQGGPGDDLLDGGDGSDTASFADLTAGVVIDLRGAPQATAAGTETLVSIENLRGTEFADSLTGDAGANALFGGGGDDRLSGGGGDDLLDGGAGSNTLVGGAGDDTAEFTGAAAGFTLSLAGSTLVVTGAGLRDLLSGVERLQFADRSVGGRDGTPLVDDLYYDARYSDVFAAGVDPDDHYAQYGAREGRDPDALFSTVGYLAANPDVKAGGVNPLAHYDAYGWKEGRDPSALFDTRLYLQHNPDVAASGVDPLAEYLQSGQAEGRQTYKAIGDHILADGFDPEFYLLANPDVAAAGVDPYRHYLTFGWKEGRDPNAWFDDRGYLAAYPDVAAAGVNPLDHYHVYGWKEGRDPSAAFDTSDYEAHYGDIAAASVDPLFHFLIFGVYEGRSAFGDGVFG